MAELPGWDRTRLAAAAEADVAAARWMVYARVLAPEVQVDYAARIREIELADMPPKKAEPVKRAARRDAVSAMRRAQVKQADFRTYLLLDEPDDPDEPGDDA